MLIRQRAGSRWAARAVLPDVGQADDATKQASGGAPGHHSAQIGVQLPLRRKQHGEARPQVDVALLGHLIQYREPGGRIGGALGEICPAAYKDFLRDKIPAFQVADDLRSQAYLNCTSTSV